MSDLAEILESLNRRDPDRAEGSFSLLSIDPGPKFSAATLLRTHLDGVECAVPFLDGAWYLENVMLSDLIGQRLSHVGYADFLMLESVQSYGRAVGQDTFDTALASGRFIQAFVDGASSPTGSSAGDRVTAEQAWNRMSFGSMRSIFFPGDMKKKEKDVHGELRRIYPRRAIIEHDVTSHKWSALAIGVAAVWKARGGRTMEYGHEDSDSDGGAAQVG